MAVLSITFFSSRFRSQQIPETEINKTQHFQREPKKETNIKTLHAICYFQFKATETTPEMAQLKYENILK